MPSVQRAARSVPSRVPVKLRLLPCQRPASPEVKLSPRATMAVVEDDGPAWAAGTTQTASAMIAQPIEATFNLPIPLPLFGCIAGAARGAPNISDAGDRTKPCNENVGGLTIHTAMSFLSFRDKRRMIDS